MPLVLAAAIFLSVLYWLKAYTDQIVAGIHPISVICNIRHMIPDIGLPMVKKVRKGKKRERIKRMENSRVGPLKIETHCSVRQPAIEILFKSNNSTMGLFCNLWE